MTLCFWFWCIYVISLLFGGYTNRAKLGEWAMGSLILYVLLGILGYAEFGSAVKH